MRTCGFVGLCIGFVAWAVMPSGASAIPILDLSITGPDTASPGQEGVTLEVQRCNSESGLGGLAYDLPFSETLWLTDREYSDHGWVANDGLFDNCNPIDDDSVVPGNYNSLRFDTVADPPGSEFPPDTCGLVEVFEVTIPDDPTPRWIFFDLENVFASNGVGDDWVQGLGGVINVDVRQEPGWNAAHAHGIWVPEPATLSLLAVGLAFVVRQRRPRSSYSSH